MKKIKAIEEVYKIPKETLYNELVDVFERQKLPKIIGNITLIIEAIVLLLVLFSAEDIFYRVIWGVGFAFCMYRLFMRNSYYKDILEDLKKIVEGIEKLKKYDNGQIKLENEEAKIKKLRKKLPKYLNPLLVNSSYLKIMAFIPFVNLTVDELYNYTNVKGPVYLLLNGKVLSSIGLKELKEIEEIKN